MKFVDLETQYSIYKKEIDEAIQGVLSSCQFINGPAVYELEKELAYYTGSDYCVACSSGTDALLAALMALDLKPGDEVVCPSFSFFATASMVSLLQGVPVFVDVDQDTFNIDPSKISKKINKNTKGIIAVSLYGQCADFDRINDIAEKNRLWVIEDAAQSFGALYNGKKSCNLTRVATTSFFPAKPLGCYGDGGAIFTNDSSLGERIRLIINHGQEKRYHHSCIGINGRMDTIQAAILLIKLKYFDEEIKKRQEIARIYSEALSAYVKTPVVLPGRTSTWAQYTVRHPKRDMIMDRLNEINIPTAIHYPMLLNKQKAFASINNIDDDYSVSQKLCKEVFSLPVHPFLSDNEIGSVCNELVKLSQL